MHVHPGQRVSPVLHRGRERQRLPVRRRHAESANTATVTDAVCELATSGACAQAVELLGATETRVPRCGDGTWIPARPVIRHLPGESELPAEPASGRLPAAGDPAQCTYCGDAIVQNPAGAPNPNEVCDNDGSNCDPANPGAACTCSTACLPCAPLTVGDFIWNDLNNNGVQDAGEPGIANVQVQILDCSGNVITTVTTDANGFYSYTQTVCDPNSLNVAISVDNTQAALTGYVHTQVGVGSDVTDSDCGKGANANTSQCTTLTVANPTNLNRDCGFVLPACELTVEKTPCVQQTVTAQPCTGGALAMQMKYTGPDISNATVIVKGGSTATAAVYSGLNLTTGTIVNANCAVPGEGKTADGVTCYTINAANHGASKLGASTTVEIDDGGGNPVYKETLHTSCSCKNNPPVNLQVGNPICLDTGSGDFFDTLCTADNTPTPPGTCCDGFDKGTCTATNVGPACTGAKTPLFCCTGAGAYGACKGEGSPLWTLTAEKDPTLGDQGPSTGGGNCSGNTLPASGCGDVTYSYKLTNSGSTTATNIECTDSNGTIGTFSVPDLAAGASTTVTPPGQPVQICGTTTNTVTCTVNGQGPTGNGKCQDSAAVLAPCTLAYPFVSSTVRTNVPFNESTVLKAFRPTGVAVAGPGDTIQAFYSDEHALTLGVSNVTVKSGGGTTSTNYPLSPDGTPQCKDHPAVGSTAQNGPQAGTDSAGTINAACAAAPDTCDRPMWPALFITDITSSANACSPAAYGSNTGPCCDWQALTNPTLAASCVAAQSAVPPSKVCGVWKGAKRTLDTTKVPNKLTVTPDADPAKNGTNLGVGSDPFPTLPAGTKLEGYGAEAIWNVDELGLQAGHTYRLQFMVHDGDQNKTGGDVGQACVNIAVPEGE